MPKLLRPYIPLEVRVQVVRRQLLARKTVFPLSQKSIVEALVYGLGSAGHRLTHLLQMLFPDGEAHHLDHDPALENRRKVFRKGVHVEYDPPANDPNHLVYRSAHDHYIKTHVRGDGAQYSDTVLAKRERRRTKGKKKARPLKSANRWPPKGSQKLKSRGFHG